MAYCILKSYKLSVEPLRVFEALNTQRHCFFLDSSLNSHYALGRYSFLGADPFYVFKTKGQNPFLRLGEILKRYKDINSNSGVPFLGGLVGYIAYDAGLILGKSIRRAVKPEADDIADCFFGLYNTVVIIDHLKELLYICALGFPERNYSLAKILAESNFKKMRSLLSRAGQVKPSRIAGKAQPPAQLNSNFTKEEYLLAIRRAKEYIKKGDIYQVNLSQQFMVRSTLSAPEIYKRLRYISPSYFGAYLDVGNCQIISCSPEEFLRLEGDRVITRPMKGTRPRGKNKIEDAFFKDELLGSEKDRAELIMIVDLERNDLGRVCSYNSIQVSTLRQLEEYNTVFQTTATIEGRLHKDKDRADLLRACFPGGSITGCPKIRAMEIIEELEPSRRSVYTGALGYLSFSGNMNFNILIRTILKKADTLHFGVGGGIVADSKPQEEYQETLVKARAMVEAIKGG